MLGAPQADHLNLTATGAVYVLLGKDGGLGKEIDPANGNTVMEFHFYGVDPGDQLGAAVACADLNGDHLGDLIVAAPGAALGAGRVYAVFGNQLIRGQAINPGSTGADAPDVTWATTADMGFGSILFAADLNGDDKAEILVASAPRSKKVHLLKNVTAQPRADQRRRRRPHHVRGHRRDGDRGRQPAAHPRRRRRRHRRFRARCGRP